MRYNRATILAVSALLVLIVLPGTAAAQDYKVVVNEANTVKELGQQQVTRCFMKQTTKWPNGLPVTPVDQAASSAVRESFSENVLGRDVSAVKSYWQRQIFSGRGVPPPEKASDGEVLAFVRANPGAVGYVSWDADLGSGVKVLRVTSD
jgi:ABC-type phosphate transport system substrate-binding protein